MQGPQGILRVPPAPAFGVGSLGASGCVGVQVCVCVCVLRGGAGDAEGGGSPSPEWT